MMIKRQYITFIYISLFLYNTYTVLLTHLSLKLGDVRYPVN